MAYWANFDRAELLCPWDEVRTRCNCDPTCPCPLVLIDQCCEASILEEEIYEAAAHFWEGEDPAPCDAEGA